MLSVIVVLTCAIAAALFVLFVAMCFGIRRDDRGAMLDQPAPGIAALLARCFTGLKFQKPCDQIRADRQPAARARERARADA